MSNLEILEARVPVRTPRLIEVDAEPRAQRLAPIASWLSGPVFSRARDIFAANMTELLDRAEDPARMIRMIILEMEETLVEVRSTAARSIADIKELQRALTRLDQLQGDWAAKAELALEKGREDLAKAALVERQKAAEMADGLRDEAAQIEAVLRGYEADIAKLQGKLREARPAECDRGADPQRGHPRPDERDDARQSYAGCVRQVRNPRAPRRLRRRPRRRAGPDRAEKPRGRNRRIEGRRGGRCRASSNEGRAQSARSIGKVKGE